MKTYRKTFIMLLIFSVIAFSALACSEQANVQSKSAVPNSATQQKQTEAAQSNIANVQNSTEPQKTKTVNAGSVELSLPVDLSTANTGATITVPVVIASKEKKEIFSYSFAIMYDPSVLKPAKPEIDAAGTLSQNSFQVVSDTQTNGRLGVAGASSGKTIPANGTLLKTRFTVVGKPAGKMELKIDKPVFEDQEGTSLEVSAKTSQQ